MAKYKIKDKLVIRGVEPGYGEYLNGQTAIVVGVEEEYGFLIYRLLCKDGNIISTTEEYLRPWYSPPTSRGDMDAKVTWAEFEEATKIPRMTVQIGPRSRY